MFRKPFLIKSNVNLRNSDRRKLSGSLLTANVISRKSQAALVKLICYDGSAVNVYTFDKEPLLFQLDNGNNIYPTVYTTWKSPSSFPCFYVHEPVFEYLQNGADLMLQGIIRSPELFPNVPKYAAVSVAVITDERKVQGPVAVGITLMSSEEMTSCGMKGKGVQILHTYRDHMWEFGSRAAPPVTDIASQPLEEMTVVDQPKFYNCLTLLEDQNASVEEVKENDKEITTLSEACALSIDQRPDEVSPNSSDESSEELLQRCFLAALKYRLTPKGLLPLDVGQFYSTMLLRCVPEGKRIDIKKTSYKKFANFLRAVNSGSAGEIVKIASKSKGIDNIIEINWNHSLLKSFELTDERVKDEDEVGKAGGVQKVSVNEYFAVTDPVLPLFGAVHGLQRGSLLLTPQIREIITTYAKSKGLSEGKYIRMDDPVMKCLVKTEEPIIDWNTLMQKVLTKMTKTFVITTADGRETVRKLDLPKIAFKVEMRSGNKKVTLVNNLSTYGIDCKALCQQIQTEAAASATLVKDVAQCEGPQLVVQGNHVSTVSKVLDEKWGINKKFIVGLELAPKKKR